MTFEEGMKKSIEESVDKKTALEKRIFELEKENEELKKQIEQMKRCSNCKNFNRDFELCFFSGGDKDYHCRNRRWELAT